MAQKMSSVKIQLFNTLEELVDENLRTFQFFLYSNEVEGFKRIPKSRAHGLDREGTVDLTVQIYGYEGAVTVSVGILRQMDFNQLADDLEKQCKEVTSSQAGKAETDLHKVRERLQSTLKEKYQNIFEGNADEGGTIYLKKIYTELHVIEGAWGGFSDEHEVVQRRTKHVGTEEPPIKASDIFKPKPDEEKRIRTVLTQGVPGMGKTVCVQKFTLSWAEGEENQDITFLFPLPFREMNPIKDEKDYTLMQLLHQFFPDIKTLDKLDTEHKVLFIFDGLDETLLPLNFKHNKVLRDQMEPASLDVLITNLITGDLLGNALIWITSRPPAVKKITRKYIDQWTEVKGFANGQWEEYFKKRFSNNNLSTRIINHVKSSRSLYIMCQIPVFCSITATVLKKMLRDNVKGSMPNTLTEMYVHLLLCQMDKMVEGHYPLKSDNFLLKLAELAFRQQEKGKQIFYKADLKECGMDEEEVTTYSGVCTEVFLMEGEGRRKVFSFVHLTIQEFLAALYAHHSYMVKKDNVFLGKMRRMSMKLAPKSMFNFHKTAIEKALESQDGHWDLFLRFLLGLSLKSNQELLFRLLNRDAEGEEDVVRTVQFIKEKINEEPESKLNLFHCLSELREESLVQEIQNLVSSGRLTAKKLSPVQWSALTFELMTSEAVEEEFDLKKYIKSEEGVEKLLNVITSSSSALLNSCNLSENCCELLASTLSSPSSHLTALDLSENRLKDSGVELLAVGLMNPHCKLKTLRLHKCYLNGGCGEVLAVALSTDSTRLTDLDLSANDFQEAGLKALSRGLSRLHCKLETLRLDQCRLGDSCCADLASVLKSGSSKLKILDLSYNNLRDSGLSLLSAGLKSPLCKLESLKLSWCGLTQKSCHPIGSALSSESESAKLKKLDLSGNNLQGPGFERLCSGLKSQRCQLETLRLNECNLQKCCADLASVLSSDSSHLKELDLSGNDLQDLEVELLSAGLANANCILERLRVSFCGVTEQGCIHLASALSSNPSYLKLMDLSYNYLQDSGEKLISAHLDSPLCKLEQLSVEHNTECYLRSTLKNYACTPTFDANTAATSLFLHDGGKQVTWVREKQQHPKHPERFESVSQVLCCQGLTQRHYWEVEWRGRWVDISVSMRGISRRASSHVCGFGCTDQSWSLYCSEDHYMAQHNNQCTDISATPPCFRKVGVFLDWPGGTLSFFSVSPWSLRHLHTFYNNFTEPLYPGFGMEEDDCSVIICTAGPTG